MADTTSKSVYSYFERHRDNSFTCRVNGCHERYSPPYFIRPVAIAEQHLRHKHSDVYDQLMCGEKLKDYQREPQLGEPKASNKQRSAFESVQRGGNSEISIDAH